jgi:hypothetical protein
MIFTTSCFIGSTARLGSRLLLIRDSLTRIDVLTGSVLLDTRGSYRVKLIKYVILPFHFLLGGGFHDNSTDVGLNIKVEKFPMTPEVTTHRKYTII